MTVARKVARWASPHMRIRPLGSGDISGLRGLFGGLSMADRRHRFHATIGRVTDGLLQSLVQVDPDREVALVASVDWAGGAVIVGEGRCAFDPNGGDAEIALLVASRWRRLGIGRRLLGELRLAALRRGAMRLTGAVLDDNVAMLALAQLSGLERVASAPGGVVIMARTLSVEPADGTRATGAHAHPQ